MKSLREIGPSGFEGHASRTKVTLVLAPVSQRPPQIDLNRSDRTRSRLASSDTPRPLRRDECAESILSARRTRTCVPMTVRSCRSSGQRDAEYGAQGKPTGMKVGIGRAPAHIDHR